MNKLLALFSFFGFFSINSLFLLNAQNDTFIHDSFSTKTEQYITSFGMDNDSVIQELKLNPYQINEEPAPYGNVINFINNLIHQVS